MVMMLMVSRYCLAYLHIIVVYTYRDAYSAVVSFLTYGYVTYDICDIRGGRRWYLINIVCLCVVYTSGNAYNIF